MKLTDRWWLWANKKPQGVYASYFHVVLPWLVFGVVLVVFPVVLLLLAVAAQAFWLRWVALGFALYVVIAVVWLAFSDRKKGIWAVLHVEWMARWREKKRRLEGERQLHDEG